MCALVLLLLRPISARFDGSIWTYHMCVAAISAPVVSIVRVVRKKAAAEPWIHTHTCTIPKSVLHLPSLAHAWPHHCITWWLFVGSERARVDRPAREGQAGCHGRDGDDIYAVSRTLFSSIFVVVGRFFGCVLRGSQHLLLRQGGTSG